MDKRSPKARLMTIFAHQDDETFSTGGVLAKYAENGQSFAVSVISDPLREKEFSQACKILGTTPINLKNKSVDSSNLGEILKQVIEIIRNYSPNHIITHVDYDYHNEHRNVRKIVEEAVEWVSHTTNEKKAVQIQSLWATETTVLIPIPEVYIDITEFNENRLSAIKCYESQSHKGGKGFYSKFHDTRTSLRGIQANVQHAEAFVQIPISLSGSFKPTKVFEYFPY